MDALTFHLSSILGVHIRPLLDIYHETLCEDGYEHLTARIGECNEKPLGHL